MSRFTKNIVVLDVVGLTQSHLAHKALTPNLNRLSSLGASALIRPPFPPVTGTVQATILTGKEPSRHGIICNGLFDPRRYEVTMWEQTGAAIHEERIWDLLKHCDPLAKTAALFWQHTKYASADIVITPSPVHLDTGMVEWCFSKPYGWYEQVCNKLGPFHLHSFWGPFVSLESSKWILNATLETFRTFQPTLTLSYLPHLDYEAQRRGPDSPEAMQSVKQIDSLIGEFCDSLYQISDPEQTAVVVISEYAIHDVHRPVYLNRILRNRGWLRVNEIAGKEYIDLYHSQAFAMVDHQVAHIYANDSVLNDVRIALEETEGIQSVLNDVEKLSWRIDHQMSGSLVAVANRTSWFPYYWWDDPDKAPHFARTVDIHRKPGYDPVELFFDSETRSIPLDAERIKGSHGCFPDSESDLVSLIGSGLAGDYVQQRDIWDARDIPTLILQILGYSK